MLWGMSERVETTKGGCANDVDVAASGPPDAYVDRALAAMTAEPARRWTVASLARVAGLSRAAFARRFRCATGKAPLQWLTDLRLGLATERLVRSDDSIAEIAFVVGYGSEFALSKAFKRRFGVAPGVYRRTATLPATSRPVCLARAA